MLPIFRLVAGWLIAIAIAITGLWLLHRYLPPQHNPFRPMLLTDPIGFATAMKLSRLKDNSAACFSALDKSGTDYTRLAAPEPLARCPIYNGLHLERSFIPYSQPIKLTCTQAAALIVWENQIVQPLAETFLGAQVSRIETYGTFSCRTIAGSRRMSQHAFGNAIDVSGFKLQNGDTVTVLNDWGRNTPEGAFLSAVENASCGVFSIVLGPDYNSAHRDHFHFDMGPGGLCQ